MNRTRAGGPVDGKARQCGSGVVLMWAAASERRRAARHVVASARPGGSGRCRRAADGGCVRRWGGLVVGGGRQGRLRVHLHAGRGVEVAAMATCPLSGSAQPQMLASRRVAVPLTFNH